MLNFTAISITTWFITAISITTWFILLQYHNMLDFTATCFILLQYQPQHACFILLEHASFHCNKDVIQLRLG